MTADNKTTVPAIVIRSISGGLLLMALFTSMWTGIAYGNLHGEDHGIVPMVFGILVIAFILFSVRFMLLSRKFPALQSEADKREGKRMGKQFGIIFGIEGTAIPIVCGGLVALGYDTFILPAIALIVGLHFYPMARIFQRTIDYYLATWTCGVAVYVLYMIARLPETLHDLPLVILGVGVAMATSAYGIFMIAEGLRFQRELRQTTPKA